MNPHRTMKLSAKRLTLATSRLLTVLSYIFLVLSGLFASGIGLPGGLAIALLVFVFLGMAILLSWAILEILLDKLSKGRFLFCAAVIGALLMLTYWLLRVGHSADMYLLPLWMVLSATGNVMIALYIHNHHIRHAGQSVPPPSRFCRNAFLAATLYMLAVTISGYLVSSYSKEIRMQVQKGETGQLRYFRPNQSYPPELRIAPDGGIWEFLKEHPVTIRSTVSQCESFLQSAGYRFTEKTRNGACELPGGFHQMKIEIMDAVPAMTGKTIHLHLTPAINFQGMSYHPYYLVAWFYIFADLLWVWLLFWGIRLYTQNRAARAPQTLPPTV